MRGIKWIGTLALLAVVSASAFAGDGKQCSYGTQECLDYMATKMKKSGWIGVELEMVENSHALQIVKVVDESPAQAAGLQAGDILFAMNGIELGVKENEEAIKKARAELKPGSSVTYTIKRNGTDREVTLTLAPMPADLLARYVGQHLLEHAAAIQEAGETAKKN